MSRAFVKETDSGGEELPDRPISSHPNYVTPEGLALIEAEIARLAAAPEAAKADRATAIDRDLRYWRARRASAQVITAPSGAGGVQFGSRVTIERDGGRSQTYRIVGEDEADPARGTLSYVSPLAQALIGKEPGDTVRIGGGEVEILTLE